MSKGKRPVIATITVMAVLSVAAAVVAEKRFEPKKKKEVRYKVVNLGTLGGTMAGANSINNRSWVTGVANLAGDQVAHATLWMGGEKIDLGTLGGPNSAVSWPVKDNKGGIAGISETDEVQPLGETFSCAPFFGTPHSGHVCRGFFYSEGAMTPMPTLGGDNSYAAGANTPGGVVGWAENTVHDPTCTLPQVLQFRAVLWTPSDGELRELPPLEGESSSSATAINNEGQIVGISGSCDRAFGRFSAAHAVIWEDGVPRNLGDLGGVAWNTPTAINQRDDIVGFANVAGGGGVSTHAVLWPRSGAIQDLDVIDDDAVSLAFGINEHGQIVGQSIGAGGSRAFLYEDGVMKDLNDLTEDGSPYLVYANDVNDRGEIAGQGCDDCASGATFAVKLIPVRE